VTTVPSSDQARDAEHPLRRIVGTDVGATGDRYEPLLVRSGTAVADRKVDRGKYNPTHDLDGESVLLVDETWTTGSNAQSAAAALKTAGASQVAVLVIGRHIHEDYKENAARLKELPRTFDWSTCAVHDVS
jgi:predicted phosphoribosyltransferase